MDSPLFLMMFKMLPQLIQPISSGKLCETDGCKWIANYLTLMVNKSADPCDNFYEFACGGYLNYTKNMTGYGIVSYGTWNRDIIDNATRNGLLKVSLRDKNVSKAFKYARRYYDACVDYDPTEDAAQQEVVDYLINFDNWPFLNKSWQADQFDVVKAVGKLQGELGLSTILTLMVDVDKLDNIRNTLYLKQGDLLYDTIQYNETIFPEFKDNYIDVVSKALQQLVINAKVSHHTVRSINKVAKAIVEFEMDLAANIIPESQANDDDITKFYHPYTLAELNNVYNSTSVWSRYFQAALGNNTKSFKWLDDNKIVVTQLDYFKFLAHKFYTTPRETIGNYLMWRLLVELGPYFDQNFLDIGLTSEQRKMLRRLTPFALDKPPKDKEKNADCLKETNSLFEHVAARFLIKERYNPPRHKAALTMTEQIWKASKKIFEQNTWLSTEAKKRLMAKLDNLVLNIGYPKWIMNDTLLNEFYMSYRIRANYSYFRSQIAFKRFSLTELFESVDRHKFVMPVITPNNAAYMPVTNALTVPAGQLEYPYFEWTFPDYYNLAVVGQTIGHEMFHGFDNTGALFDENGNVSLAQIEENKHWVLADSDEKFQNLTQCLVVDYSQYCYILPTFFQNITAVDEEEQTTTEATTEETTTEETSQLLNNCVDGEKTLGENIADLDGLKASYLAFKDLYNEKEYQMLKGFEKFTVEQMYFVSYASQYCARLSPDLKIVEIFLTDEHSPNDARVNALLRNFPEFREAFKCPSNSFMYSNNNNEFCTLY